MAKKPIKVLFKKLCKDAVIPTKAHEGDACYDLTAVSCVYDHNLDAYVYGTGLAIETNVTTGMFIHPRSSVRKTDAFLTNAVGIVDPKEYRGEIMLTYKNRDSLKMRIFHTALAQLAVLPWYKRMFTNFKSILDSVEKEYHDKIYELAPFKVGDRIGQFWIAEMSPLSIETVKKLSSTSRGTGGHGSTGK